MSKLRRTMPTEEGKELGLLIGKMTDMAEAESLSKFPNHAERCRSCAFRSGTFPNGCPETLMDAIQCVVDNEPFYCHQNMIDGKPSDICAGWFIASDAARSNDGLLVEKLRPFVEDWENIKSD